jgi:ferric-dicitrate binding protein FerR (iron transport regulator)
VTRTHYKFACVLVLMLLTLPLWAQNGSAGQISAVEGKVSLVRGNAVPVLLREHDPVQAGDSILTDAKSSATMRLPDGSTVRIFPNSHVLLRSETGAWTEFLHVLLGNVRIQIEKLSGRPNPKTVTTPTAIIAVRGTIFAVAVEQNEDTRVGLEKGLLAVTSQLHPEQEVLVKPGQEVWVRQGQGPTQPHQMQRAMPGLTRTDSAGSGMRGMGVGGASRPSGTGRRSPQR